MTELPTKVTAAKEELLTQDELAAELGKSVAWAERARWNGSGPAFVKIGRSVRYRRSAINAWLESQSRTWTRAVA